MHPTVQVSTLHLRHQCSVYASARQHVLSTKLPGDVDACAIVKGLRDYSGIGSSEYSQVF